MGHPHMSLMASCTKIRDSGSDIIKKNVIFVFLCLVQNRLGYQSAYVIVMFHSDTGSNTGTGYQLFLSFHESIYVKILISIYVKILQDLWFH